MRPGLRRALAVLAVLAVAAALAASVRAQGLTTTADEERMRFLADDQCYVCHLEEDMLPEGFDDGDVHVQHGLSCAGCHGGDPTSDDEDVAMSEAAGFVGVPTRRDIAEFCGRCHSSIDFMRRYQPRIPTDQVAQYYTSRHGQKLREGDTRVADCTSCHTSHAIHPAGDARSTVHPLHVPDTCNHCHGDTERMASYGIPTDQHEKYAGSVHGVALLENQDTGAPACNDCHGNHGALPPGLASISQVCGTCHVNNLQYFSATRMAEAFEEEGFHGCEECHGNHAIAHATDDLVGTTNDAVCMDCHDDGDKGWESAAAIREQLRTLTTIYNEAIAMQEEVQRKGMDDVEIDFLLQESRQSLIQARTLVHTFDPEKVAPKADEGTAKATEAVAAAHAAVEEYYFRRRGFGLATIFITVLIVALAFKVRQMERG
jgi:hypothetical protein